MAANLVIVESPSKAKTLKKYLGSEFEVLASFGHVRDLIAKQGAVDPEHEFAMHYEPISRNGKHVDAIAKAAKEAQTLYLATDPDREGEAIAWHLMELLRGKNALKGKQVKRVVFHEITRSAVLDAIAHPRDISQDLVDAQQARRALDHLVGFNLSPLLWRKIGPSLSAGRVQSPALRLIVERELEIEAFTPREYWTIHLDSHKGTQKFGARLIQYRGSKVEQFTVGDAGRSQEIVDELTKAADGQAKVVNVQKRPKQRQAAAPFTTSTLQQEAVRKLGFSTERTMRVAQQLYEGVDLGGTTIGLITYMRTDSVNLANEAIADIRGYIGGKFDAPYLPKAPVTYENKSKNAQEAHEAIRPTSISRTPDSVREFLNPDQFRLYEMVWKRTLASQMSPARFDTTSVDIAVGANDNLFRASGQVLVFPGFIAVYQEGLDDAEEGDEGKLPALDTGDALPVDALRGEQHYTQPPPRYTEASLVKTLEEYGIGRPSTYASIISTLLDREYAVLEKKRFQPTAIGRLVNAFLTKRFTTYVDYDFTARLEDQLDEISNGSRRWIPVLGDFWRDFKHKLVENEDVPPGDPLDEDCPKCGKQLFLRNSKRGLFVGCSGYPECDYTRPWKEESQPEPQVLGTDPVSGLDVVLLKGPYGHYVQLGPNDKEAGKKPKRASWPKELPLSQADLDKALQLLSLPRLLGNHPATGKPVEANIGRFGPYVKHDGEFRSIPKGESVFSIDLDGAVELLAKEKSARGALKQLGAHPEDGKPITVGKGRYGPYVKHGTVYATIPDSIDPEAVTLEQAVELLTAKAAKGDGGKKKTAAKGGRTTKAKASKATA